MGDSHLNSENHPTMGKKKKKKKHLSIKIHPTIIRNHSSPQQA